ncbi:hypothetical protein JGU71_18315 [Antrihabitans sp. YC3-6]|uniref:Uncharacterized protein n=1 Tax=Antrihabitans stalagmiti TaxID=2799499 RepID=A0A934NT62_9NOCA|nr:DUF6153 family protein [Antrihabitans stalagmiti]MBJ8340842.1 hypothetical protein [Antrihabitans stalagmiti]
MGVKACGAAVKARHLLRVAAVLAVLFGVLFMHSLPLSHPIRAKVASAEPVADGHAHSHDVSAAIASTGGVPSLQSGLCTGDCSCHSGMQHLCLAVLTIAAALIVVKSMSPTSTSDHHHHSVASWFRTHSGRAPPWTVPTLAQLSVLRV